ncbi:hypothetical protein [Microbacterium marmarense]|uniref:Uncharacterized protein n=1 Tax=Microbacterium marmarense TaxID=3122051 RepID=A0ABU8LUR1_9MICO
MKRRTRHRSRAAQILAIVAVVVLAIGVAALAMLALTQSKGTSTTASVSPVPTFDLGVDTDAETASPTPSVQATVSFDPAKERFLTVGSGVMWRGIAGECGSVAPVIERSLDDGETWVDVTPTYREIGQLLALESFADGQAEVIALVGADCEPQALRTFTQGEFWEPYPEVLASATFISPDASGTVVMAGVEVEAPCDAPHGIRTAGANVVLICDWMAYVGNVELASESGGDEWNAVDAQDVIAITTTTDSVAVAHLDESCDGLAVSVINFADDALATASSICAEEADGASPAALAIASPAGDVLWSGDSLVQLP